MSFLSWRDIWLKLRYNIKQYQGKSLINGVCMGLFLVLR